MGVAKARLEREELKLRSLRQQLTGYYIHCEVFVSAKSLSLTCSAAQEWQREKNNIIAFYTR